MIKLRKDTIAILETIAYLILIVCSLGLIELPRLIITMAIRRALHDDE